MAKKNTSSAAFLFFFFYLYSLKCFCGANDIPHLTIEENNNDSMMLVKTIYGTVRGFPTIVRSTANNDGPERVVRTFLGVPFARPPINELRFEKPLEPHKWTGVKNTTKMSPACFPHVRKAMWSPEKDHSEDCLYMNIWTPGWKPENGEKLFPVLFYVHGGGFQSGSIRGYSSEVMAQKYVLKGILVVAFQYRLGQFGFAATGDEKFAGNYGLWDQLRALEFVHENIERFGGDPQRVTVWGFSAGAASASALSIAPRAAPLFQQAIQQSGAFFAEWSSSNRVLVETEKMAVEIGCAEQLADSERLKKCLKSKSVHELLDAVERMGPVRKELNSLLFAPRLDADFFPSDQLTLLKEAPPKRLLGGVAELDGLPFTLLGEEGTMNGVMVPPEERANFGRLQFEQFIRGKVAPVKLFSKGEEEAKEVQRRIIDFYLAGAEEKEKIAALADDGTETAFFLRKYTEVVTDTMFIVPMLQEALLKTANEWPVYLYMIDYYNKKYYPADVPVRGSYHAVELPALFDIRLFPFIIKDYTEEDIAFNRVLLDTLINFVLTGDPGIPALKWPALNETKPLQFARLNADPKMESDCELFPQKLKFWEQLAEDFSFDIIRGVQKETLRSRDEL